jgi:hypothetical protein
MRSALDTRRAALLKENQVAPNCDNMAGTQRNLPDAARRTMLTSSEFSKLAHSWREAGGADSDPYATTVCSLVDVVWQPVMSTVRKVNYHANRLP